MDNDNSVYIGKKPSMNYVLAVVTQFNKGSGEVVIKARGRAINRAVDVAEIVRHRFVPEAKVKDILIDTEPMKIEGQKDINISSIEIYLEKPTDKSTGSDMDTQEEPRPETDVQEKPSDVNPAGEK